MDDKAFDPCECISNNELAVDRLLSILRLTQNYCSDIECYRPWRLPGPRSAQPNSDFFLTCLVFAFLLLMYILRPRPLRQLSVNEPKSQNEESDSNGDPPASPPAVN